MTDILSPVQQGVRDRMPEPASPAAEAASPSFLDILSSLNPLHHVPVLGTIYRAVTGDTIPDAARVAGSLVFSGLMFGPLGLASAAASAAFGQATGLDSETIGRGLLGAGTDRPTSGEAVPQAASAGAASAGPPSPVGDGPGRAVLPAQLAAYGVSGTVRDGLRWEGIEGADVLNAIELMRIGTPTAIAAAYGRNGTGQVPVAA